MRRIFTRYRKAIKKISDILLMETIEMGEQIRGSDWSVQFRLACDIKTSQETRAQILSEDLLIKIALIWGAGESRQKGLFDMLAEKHKDTNNWPIIGSVVCSPLCSPSILHYFGTGQAKERGYGYLLRVISRNRNVKRETLESIAKDPKLEKRYTEVAQAALEGGNEATKAQI